jgi:hypothetical protein
MNIYGTIGYTILKNPNTKQKIIIFADMHDTLAKCKNNISIANWIKTKFKNSYILLEEVPRKNIDLGDLWLSEHTQQLKNLFLNNYDKVIGVDIRLSLIPYSWEIIANEKQLDNFVLNNYIKEINNFFCFNQSQMKQDWKHYNHKNITNTLLGKHFVKIKELYYNYLITYKEYLQKDIIQIYKENKEILQKTNDILNDIMEWTICALIYNNQHKPIVLHAGLFHTEKVIDWLINNYNYKIIKKQGINRIIDTPTLTTEIDGCVSLSNEDNIYFEQ